MTLASRRFFLSGLILLCAAPLFAASSTSSAHGQIRYDANGSTATIHFNVHQDAVTGDTTGTIAFSGPLELTPGNFTDVTFKADVNCAVFAITEASLSGVVTTSSVPALIGTQTLLTVEDNGHGNGKNSAPDLYTFVSTSASDCHSFPPPSQAVVDGEVHVRPATVPFF